MGSPAGYCSVMAENNPSQGAWELAQTWARSMGDFTDCDCPISFQLDLNPRQQKWSNNIPLSSEGVGAGSGPGVCKWFFWTFFFFKRAHFLAE